MNGPGGGPTSRAVGVTNHPIRIAAPAQKPPATIWITRSVVIIMSFYHNVDVPTCQTGAATLPVFPAAQRLGHANAGLTLTVHGHMIPTDDTAAADVIPTSARRGRIRS